MDEAYIVAALQEKVAQRPVTYGELATIGDGAVWWERMGYPDARAQLKKLDPDADFSVATDSAGAPTFVLNELLQQQAAWPCKEVPCADEDIADAISAYNAASNAYLQEKLGLSRTELIELGAVVEV